MHHGPEQSLDLAESNAQCPAHPELSSSTRGGLKGLTGPRSGRGGATEQAAHPPTRRMEKKSIQKSPKSGAKMAW